MHLWKRFKTECVFQAGKIETSLEYYQVRVVLITVCENTSYPKVTKARDGVQCIPNIIPRILGVSVKKSLWENFKT
jgi:hypothetical protein